MQLPTVVLSSWITSNLIAVHPQIPGRKARQFHGMQSRAGEKSTGQKCPLGLSKPIQHCIFLSLKEPRCAMMHCLWNDDDTWVLQRLTVPDKWIAQHQQPGKLHAGVLQRTKSHSYLELDALALARIHEVPPDAIVNVMTLNTPLLAEQAQWFSMQDVVFAAHSAALTNSMFLWHQLIVMQFYPSACFWQSLDLLIEQARSVALNWCPKKVTGGDPLVRCHTAERNKQNAGRDSNITLLNVKGNIDVIRVITPVNALCSLGKLQLKSKPN